MKTDGTGIRLTRRETEDGTVSRIQGLFILMLYFYMGVYGCVYAFLGVYEIPCEARLLANAILALGIFFAVVSVSGKYAKYLIMIAILAYVWVIYRNFDALQIGGNVALETIRRAISAYQNGSAAGMQDLADSSREGFLFIMAIVFPWSGIMFSALILHGGRLFIVMSMAIVMSAVLAVGQAPDFAAVCLMMGCLIGVFSTDGLECMNGMKAGTLLTMVLAALLMAVGSRYVSPVLEPLFANEAQLKSKIQNGSFMQEISSLISGDDASWAVTGVGNGELGNADYISSNNENVLKLVTDNEPEETVYLRCYTGAYYTGESWEEADDSVSESAGEAYFESFLQAAEQNGLSGPYSMEVSLQDNAGDYDYQPYYSQLEGMEDGTYTYSYFPRALVEEWDVAEPEDASWGQSYSAYVYATYTDYTESSLTRLREVCSSYRPDSLEELCAFIVSYLDQNAAYNLSVGRFPEGEDFAEYFLFEKHEGYCVHFATAATLMFRMYGVPARYVTGYVASADDFEKDGANYSAWVKDSRAHAWTEIYVDGQGWTPVEVTPGYAQTESASVNSEQSTEEETQAESPEETQAQTDGESENETEALENEGSGIPAWALWALLAISFAVILVCVRKQWILRKREKQGVKEIFRDVCEVMELAGFADEAECQDEAFLENALAKFGWLDREDFARLIDIAMRANFGREPMTADEEKFARKMYRTICRRVYRELPAWKKLEFRFYYCYQ